MVKIESFSGNIMEDIIAPQPQLFFKILPDCPFSDVLPVVAKVISLTGAFTYSCHLSA